MTYSDYKACRMFSIIYGNGVNKELIKDYYKSFQFSIMRSKEALYDLKNDILGVKMINKIKVIIAKLKSWLISVVKVLKRLF